MKISNPARAFLYMSVLAAVVTGCESPIPPGAPPASGGESCPAGDSVSTAQPLPKSAIAPAPITTQVGGATHTMTWDGRITVLRSFNSQGQLGWFLRVVRPQLIGRDGEGRPVFNDSAFSPIATWDLDSNPDTGASELNTLAITPAPGYAENPYRSNEDGGADPAGLYATYEVNVFTPLRDIVMGIRRGRIIVSSPETAGAAIHRAEFFGPFQPLRTTGGKGNIRGLEPTVTHDGRLMIYQGTAKNDGGIDWLLYSFNPNPGSVDGWSDPRTIVDMYYFESDRNVAGIPFHERYPIAKKALVDASGKTYLPTTPYYGAYPWLSQDGTELFHTGTTGGCRQSNPACPEGRWGEFALRGGEMVVGRWTGWTDRYIDGPINQSRKGETPDRPTLRILFSSPGAVSTMWSPYPEVADLPIPYTGGRPLYPLIGSALSDYNEVSFEDHEDGNYAVYLGMNEMLLRKGNFDLSQTPDTSGNLNNGKLESANFPLEYNGVDENVGKKGQAIYFRDRAAVRVKNSGSIQDFPAGFTAEVFVKRLVDLDPVPGNLYRYLFNKAGQFDLILEKGGAVQASIYTRNSSGGVDQRRSGGVGPALPVGQWVHVAMTYDPGEGVLKTYIDGTLRMENHFTPAALASGAKDLLVGPGGQVSPPAPDQNQALMILDEVKISKVVRSEREIQISAFQYRQPSFNQDSISVPLGFRQQDLRIPDGNPYNDRVARLGQRLFFDPILSRERVVSCATCHDPGLAFTDGRKKGRGPAENELKRNTPTLVNRAFSTLQFWDGRSENLEAQALVPIANPEEMNLGIDEAVSRLRGEDGYAQEFRNAFGDDPSPSNLGRALATFQRGLLSGHSRVDRYEHGETGALNYAEARGRAVFRGSGRCIGCHSGPNYTDEAFHNTAGACGNDNGLSDITGRARDQRAFKTPTLRDVSKTAPYLHGGQAATLEEVIELYNRGGAHKFNRDSEIRPLGLSAQERSDLAAFLRALDSGL